MKTSLATSLSVIGVLATGGVAMAVNTTVLNSSVSAVDGTPALAAAYVPVSVLPVETQNAISDSVPVNSTFPINETADVPELAQTSYDVASAGVITLEQSDSGLSVVSVMPISGWKYGSKSEDSDRVEIEFTNGAQRTEFKAKLIDGRIVTAVESTDSFIASPRNHHNDDANDVHSDDEMETGDDD